MPQPISKYILAIKMIEPCSPKQIRQTVNEMHQTGTIGDDREVTPQTTASALKNLLTRGKIKKADNGLYMTHKKYEEMYGGK